MTAVNRTASGDGAFVEVVVWVAKAEIEMLSVEQAREKFEPKLPEWWKE